MGNKLGFHVLKAGALADISGTKPAVIKFVGDWGSAQFVPDGVLIIGRRCESRDAQFQMNQGKTAQQAASEYVSWQLNTYNTNSILYWEGHNEPVGDAGFMSWYAQFEIERMRIMSELGYRCVIGNFATGTPDLALWEYFLPALQEAPKYKALLGLHEYSCPWMWWMYGANQMDPDEDQGDEGWTTCRYRKVIRQVLEPNNLRVPIVITECGIDPGVNPRPPGTPAGTWKELGDFWKENTKPWVWDDSAHYYADQLIWYENQLRMDDLVVGCTIFTLGSFGGTLWENFDIAGTGVMPRLVTYMLYEPAEDFEYDIDESEPPYISNSPIVILNDSFDSDSDYTHECLIFDKDGKISYRAEIGEAFVPQKALFAYWKHDPGTFDQPECGYIWGSDYPERVLNSLGAYKWFWTGRTGEGGLAYSVDDVQVGDILEVNAFGHAWSNHNLVGHMDCFEKPLCSAGVGTDAVVLYEKDIPPVLGLDPWSDALGNAQFILGIDPTGGESPFADTVKWGQPVYIYNKYAAIPSIGCIAESDIVTVFVKYKALWKFKHNDFYLDNLTVTWIPELEPPRGIPRVQYARTYVLLPNDAGLDWARAAVAGSWDLNRWTIGGSADDAGIGDLDKRRVIAVNPHLWDGLKDFYRKHYPGIFLVEVNVKTPMELTAALLELDGDF